MWMSHPSLPGIVKTVLDSAFYGGWDTLGWVEDVAPAGPPLPDQGWPVSEGEISELLAEALLAGGGISAAGVDDKIDADRANQDALLSSTFARPLGERFRRAAAIAKGLNSIERPVMTSPPVITTAITDLDATLTKTVYFTVSAANAACYRYRGGTPFVSGIYYKFPVVTLPATVGNIDATHSAVGWAVEFMTDAPKVQVFAANSTSPQGLMFEVDGVAVAAVPTAFPQTNGGSYMLLDFTASGGATTRRIRVEGDQASGMRGVHVGPTYTVWTPADADPLTVASVGDSVSAQTGVTQPNGGWNISLGKLLGWADVRQVALGGTGWVNPGGFVSPFAHAARVADAVATAPDLLMLTGSTNDSASTPAVITAAVLAGLQAYRAALPLTPIVLGGVWPGASGPSAATLANEIAVQAAFTAWGDSNSWFVPISTDSAGSWVTGTGHIGALAGTGNADRYIGAADTVHPGQAGHTYYARRWATALRKSVLPNIR